MLEQIVDRRRELDRRAKRVSIRLPDRRLGFIRRQAQGSAARVAYSRMLAVYRSRPWALVLVLVAVAALNVVDLALTLYAVERGATELNPVMAVLIGADPRLAAVFKVTIVLGVVAAMWVLRRYRRMLEASLLLLGGFALVTAYSITMMLVLG